MKFVDWEEAARRIPLLTPVRATREVLYLDSEGSVLLRPGLEGLVMRHGQEGERLDYTGDPTWLDGFIVQFFEALIAIRIVHYHLEYFIDGQWQLFDQVMSEGLRHDLR